MTLLLTDDEAVAIAVSNGSFWPSGLPTVDSTDETALGLASFRGHRSLIVRGLLGDDGAVTPEVASLTARLTGQRSFLCVYLADNDFRRVSWGLSSWHYPSSEPWILESVNPLGIHRLTEQPSADHRAYLEALLGSAMSAGPGEEGSEWLCVSAAHDRGATVVGARRSELRVVAFDETGSAIDDGQPRIPPYPAAAIALLLETVSATV